jgi:hypothetical protein
VLNIKYYAREHSKYVKTKVIGHILRRNHLIKHIIKEIKMEMEEYEEDISSYWLKREDARN